MTSSTSHLDQAPAVRQDFPDTGLTVLRCDRTKIILRTVRRFKHRPAQCDLLHLDLWHQGVNVLRDGGTYSYNAPDGAGSYFKSAAAHNTIQFDDHDQMPELGRFLYGAWPAGMVTLPADEPNCVQASYRDWQGCRHERIVTLGSDRCCVTDRLQGFRQQAVLRWHLDPGFEWSIEQGSCRSTIAAIDVHSDAPIQQKLSQGWESLYYGDRNAIPVLEAFLDAATQPAAINTVIRLLRA